MEIIEGKKYNLLRDTYIKLFVDTNNQYYVHYIQNRNHYSDGLCYTGYLWDVFKSSQVISYEEAIKKILSKKELCVFWDIHSKENIFNESYWQYPKESIIQLSSEEFIETLNRFPEDIYIFDTNFCWTIAFTHEEIHKKRFCLYQEI